MATLKVTQALRSAIYQAARARLGRSERANLLLEAGYREARPGFGNRWGTTHNSRLWADDADLCDMTKLRDLREVEVDTDGRCELDLYCYAGPVTKRGDYRELQTNVYVLFDASGVLDTADVMERGPLALDPHRAQLWGSTPEDVAAWEACRERSGGAVQTSR